MCQAILGPGYNIIPEGLNNRTTVYSDTISTEGEYDCNGRATLASTLHTHKPLDIIILALGANDLKSKFSATPRDIAIGVRILAKDVQNYVNLGHFIQQDPNSRDSNSNMIQILPKLLIIGPPIVQLTALNKLWGFPDDVTSRAKKLSTLMFVLSKELGVDYIDMSSIVSPSSQDGVHYSADDQEKIAQVVAAKIAFLCPPHSP
jgi:lysophospholipase L1-like esterase